jgi:hypothetical protein
LNKLLTLTIDKAGNEELSTGETTSHGIASLLDGVFGMRLDVGQNVVVSEEVYPHSS